MGDYSEFSLPVRLFLATYPWRRINPTPWSPLAKPLAQCRVAIVSSAGFTSPGQIPFDNSIRGGDPSFRVIDAHANPGEFTESHRSESFDHTGIARDPNLAFPLDRLRELAADRLIAGLAPRHLSFMGSIIAPGRFQRDSLPGMVRILKADLADLALLVPV